MISRSRSDREYQGQSQHQTSPESGDRPQTHWWFWLGGVCDQTAQDCGELDQACSNVAGARPDGPGQLMMGPGSWTGWGNPKMGGEGGEWWTGRGKHSGPCQNCRHRAILPKWKRFQCSANFVK